MCQSSLGVHIIRKQNTKHSYSLQSIGGKKSISMHSYNSGLSVPSMAACLQVCQVCVLSYVCLHSRNPSMQYQRNCTVHVSYELCSVLGVFSSTIKENWRQTDLLKDKKYSKCCKTSFFSHTNNSHHMVTKKQTYSNKQVTCTVWWESALLIECSRKEKFHIVVFELKCTYYNLWCFDHAYYITLAFPGIQLFMR